MKYLTLTFIAIVAAKKKCKTGEDRVCKSGFTWNDDACACFTDAKCKMLCPRGQTLSELEMCKCVPLCEYDSLFFEKDLCKMPKLMSAEKAEEGEVCEGYDEAADAAHPSCEDGLVCTQTCEVSTPGACNTCEEPEEIQEEESGSLYGLSAAAIGLLGIALM